MRILKNKISIIISVLNAEKTLKYCIDSCLRLNYLNKEIIIVDGGSIDKTIQVLKNYKKKIKYITKKDKGIYQAWNRGLNICTGEWVCFIGADDYWKNKNALTNLINSCLDNNCNFASAKVSLINKKKKKLYSLGKRWNYRALYKNIQIAQPGSLHHRSLLKKKSFDENFKISGDHDFYIRTGQKIRATFLDKEIIVMINTGVSNKYPLIAFYESYKALKNSQNFGLFHGLYFLITSCAKYFLKSLFVIKIFRRS
jgi:glycosyltransferase involved in cell wall biosynthesis